MKKFIRFALTAAGIAAIPAAINHYIYKRYDKKYEMNYEKKRVTRAKELVYEWVYGDIVYTKTGKGAPLLLIHGISFAGASRCEWEKIIGSLSKNRTVYALDLLGFGYSGKPAVTYTAYLYSRLINDFIRNVIGTGTAVAASAESASFAVAAYCLDSRWIDKLLLISPTGAGTTRSIPGKFELAVKKILEAPLIGTTFYTTLTSRLILSWRLKKHCLYGAERELLSKYHDAAHYEGVNAKYPVAARIANCLAVDIERLIPRVDIPVHIVWGGDNTLNPPSNCMYIKKSNPNVTFTVFEKAGVCPHIENPRAFIKECRLFLNGDI